MSEDLEAMALEEKAKEFYRYFRKKDGDMPKLGNFDLADVRDYLLNNDYLIRIESGGYDGTPKGDDWALV